MPLRQLPYIKTLLDFQRALPDEQACLDYIEKVRWPTGFVCSGCAALGEPYRVSTRPRVLVCRTCRGETSLTAGTVMHRTKTPLHVWFWAAYLVTSQTPGMSALQFRRQLGVKRYETAFQMLHKLRAAMVRQNRDRIGRGVDRETGLIRRYTVEMDEAYVGGRTRGKGKGVTEKVVVVGAVEVRKGRKEDPVTGEVKERLHAGRLRLRKVSDRGRKPLTKFAVDSIEPGTTIKTDDWVGYDKLYLWFDHQPVMADEGTKALSPSEQKAERGEKMPMIHLVFSNLKTWIQGTHHGVSPKHLQAYLNEYVFRFNRRFYPMSGFHALLNIAVAKHGPEYAGLYEGTWEHPNPLEEQ